MLEVRIRKKLRDFSLEVSLQAEPGKILVVMGANGSGKSTTLGTIAGLIHPDEGRVKLGSEVLFDSEDGTCIPPEERRIGYVFQNSAVFPHLSVTENVAFGLRARREIPAATRARVAHLLDQVGIPDLASVRARDLSGGQKQRVALARAIAIRPGLLMLDEPFTSLDPKGIQAIRHLTRTVVDDLRIPCILVTHRAADIADIGDRACILSQGKVEWKGRPCDLPDYAPACRCP